MKKFTDLSPDELGIILTVVCLGLSVYSMDLNASIAWACCLLAEIELYKNNKDLK